MNRGQSSIEISAFVALDGDVEVEYLVCGLNEVVEFTIGGRDGFHLEASEGGLERLVEVLPRALAELRGEAVR